MFKLDHHISSNSDTYLGCTRNALNNSVDSEHKKRFQHMRLCFRDTRKHPLTNSHFICALLTDLSKPFDCLEHYLFVVKLKAHDFNLPTLRSISDYL